MEKPFDLIKCRTCKESKYRRIKEIKAGAKRDTYVDEDEHGELWHGKQCPLCFKKHKAEAIANKRIQMPTPPKEPSIKKQCQVCSKEFLTHNPAKLRCSKECAAYYASHKFNPRVLKYRKLNCIICDKEFIPNMARQKTCGSLECKTQNLSNYRNSKKPVKIPKHCKTCHKLIEHKGQYCKKACYPKKEHVPKPKALIIKECQICKSRFKRVSSAMKFCSKQCADETHKLIKRKFKRKKTVAYKIGRRYYKKLREMRERQRLPKWADKQAIRLFYKECPKGMFVDHILPLGGVDVTGLHTIDNFQYLPLLENSFKSNKWDGTYQNEGWRIEFEEWKIE